MPDYLTPVYRNTDEGRPVWKRPAFLIIAALIVLAVVGAAYFLNGEETDGSSGSSSSGGGHTTDERRRSAGLSRSQTTASSRPGSTSRITTEARTHRHRRSILYMDTADPRLETLAATTDLTGRPHNQPTRFVTNSNRGGEADDLLTASADWLVPLTL
jgi:hypothetical protein